MKRYFLPLEKMPIICFAHTYRTSAESWKLGCLKDIYEITYVKKGTLRVYNESSELIIPPGSVACIDHSIESTAENIERDHQHMTVAFAVEGMYLGENAPAGRYAEIPMLAGGDDVGIICSDISRIIASVTENPVRRLALLMTLFGDMTALAASGVASRNPLTSRAKKLIEENCELPGGISPAAIADMLSVSYGYLSRVFKNEEGMTLTDYINRRRLERVREILYISNITLEKAGESVGFGDVKYLSRLFHSVYGITAREYISSVRTRE